MGNNVISCLFLLHTTNECHVLHDSCHFLYVPRGSSDLPFLWGILCNTHSHYPIFFLFMPMHDWNGGNLLPLNTMIECGGWWSAGGRATLQCVTKHAIETLNLMLVQMEKEHTPTVLCLYCTWRYAITTLRNWLIASSRVCKSHFYF